MSASSSIQLPEHLISTARDQASQRGLSVDEWIAIAVAEHLSGTEAAEEHFRNRTAGARRGALREALDAVPDNPPDPGDEL